MIVYEPVWFTEGNFIMIELEAENSLFFKITLTPFGGVDTPSFN